MRSSLSYVSISTFVALLFLTTIVEADVVTLDNVSTRNNGPFVADVSFTPNGTSHGNAPLVISVSAVNQDGDGDGVLDDSFTFDLTASTTNTNGVSLWNQGTNISNAAGSNTSFGTLGDLTFTVSNVSGTNTAGETFVFDGFTGVTVASGDGDANLPATQNRSIDFNGLTANFDNTGTTDNGFSFAQEPFSFAPVASLTFDNQGVANSDFNGDGTLVVRELDLQFSTVASVVPEPSSLALLGLAGFGFMTRRRRG